MDTNEYKNKLEHELDWDIIEATNNDEIENTYCGEIDDWKVDKTNLSSAIIISVYTFCLLVIAGTAYGLITNDWTPLKTISECICNIIDSIKR